MNALYIILGIALLIFGIWLTKREIKIYMKGKQDKLGADIKMLGGGIMAIIIGIALILEYA